MGKRCGVAAVLAVTIVVSAGLAHDDGKGIEHSSPPGIAGNGPFPSWNIELLAHMPLSQIGGGQSNVLGNDCWGWTDPLTRREYAIYGRTNGTSFIDISDPRNPVYLGDLPTATTNQVWRDIKVYQNHAFVVADNAGAHGMQVFDLTRLRGVSGTPQTFTADARYTGIGSAHNVAINEDTGFAYLVGSNQANGGLHMVNIQNPTAPVFAGNFSADGYTHDTQVVTYRGPDAQHVGREIAFNSNEDTLTIVDVTSKSSPLMLSRKGYPQSAYTHQGWLTEDQRYFLVDDELDERNGLVSRTATRVWDVSDLENPVYLGAHLGVLNTIDHNQYIKGNLTFQANYSSGLRVLEIVDPQQALLREIAFFDTYPTDNNISFNGAWSVYPYFESGSIIVSDRQNGLFVLQLSPIPEPATWAMVGLAALGFVARRYWVRKKERQHRAQAA